MKLRRITTGGQWIPEIDGLRFVAILSVVCFHVMGQLERRMGYTVAVQPRYDLLHTMIGNGDRGVSLFFVISGYILARPFLRQHLQGGKRVGIGSYFMRRLTRLEPPYVLSLLIYTAAFLVFPGTPLRTMLPHLLASMAYLHNLVFAQMSTINFVTWSLEIEVQFYLLAPLLGLIYAVRHTLLRRSIFVTLILACGAFHLVAHGVWLMTLPNFGHFFITGFLLADILASAPAPTRHYPAWDVVSLVGWPTVFLLPHADATLQWLPFLILPLYLAAFRGPVTNRFFRLNPVAIVGGMCYSFYLMHMLVISIASKFTRHLYLGHDFLLDYLIQLVLLGACVTLAGTAYFVLIERPCMDPQWPHKLWQRLRRPATA